MYWKVFLCSLWAPLSNPKEWWRLFRKKDTLMKFGSLGSAQYPKNNEVLGKNMIHHQFFGVYSNFFQNPFAMKCSCFLWVSQESMSFWICTKMHAQLPMEGKFSLVGDGGFSTTSRLQIGAMLLLLVGGLEHEFYDFPFSWEFHTPNWLSLIFFFRGVGIPPTRLLLLLTLVLWVLARFLSYSIHHHASVSTPALLLLVQLFGQAVRSWHPDIWSGPRSLGTLLRWFRR